MATPPWLHPEGRWLQLILAAALVGLILARIVSYMTQEQCAQRGGRWDWSDRTCHIEVPVAPTADRI